MGPVTMWRRCFLTIPWPLAGKRADAGLVSVRRIWDAGEHNAFTDLLRFRGHWYCVFREGRAHVSPDGKLRVLTSPDGEQWSPAALIASPLGDLRDAKLAATPRGELLLSGAAALAQPAAHRHQSLSWLSKDGRNWSDAVPVGDPDFWLWRVTWRGADGYGIGYSTAVNRNLRTARLYHTRDGRSFRRIVEDLGIPGSPGESVMRFRRDGSAVCLLRRDPYSGQPAIPESAATALVGNARPPYRDWEWKDLGRRIGGPNMIEFRGGRYIAVVRLHDGRTRTAVCSLDPAGGLDELLTLPSGGDSSYAGLVWHQGLLWVSYYSSHEGKTSIYLAKVRIAG